jgi:hypothetical protein
MSSLTYKLRNLIHSAIGQKESADELIDVIESSGPSSDSFTTIQTPAGTSPVAGSPSDILTLVAGSGISIVGNSATDTITFSVTGGSGITQLTGEVTAGPGSGSQVATLNKTAITNKTFVALSPFDTTVISDTSDSGNLKQVTMAAIAALAPVYAPGGSDGSVQFNDLGNFGGGGAFTFNKLNGYLNVPFLAYAGGGQELLSDVGIMKDSTGVLSLDVNSRGFYDGSGNISLDWGAGSFNAPDGSGSLTYSMRQLLDSSSLPSVYWDVRQLVDSGGFKAMEWTSSQRQLFDFGGSYPSVDFGNYELLNIGITNAGGLLRWGVGEGGSVKIYHGASATLVGDFTNGILYSQSSSAATLDWQQRIAYDNTSQASIDWDYHYLVSGGSISVDWQNKYLYSDAFGGVIAVDYGDHLLNNGGGFLSINFTDHKCYDQGGSNVTIDYHNRVAYDSSSGAAVDWENKTLRASSIDKIDWANAKLVDTTNALSLSWEDRALKATNGTTTVLNWSTQQPSSGPQTAGVVYTATEQTMIQEMYDALRAYGLLS